MRHPGQLACIQHHAITFQHKADAAIVRADDFDLARSVIGLQACAHHRDPQAAQLLAAVARSIGGDQGKDIGTALRLAGQHQLAREFVNVQRGIAARLETQAKQARAAVAHIHRLWGVNRLRCTTGADLGHRLSTGRDRGRELVQVVDPQDHGLLAGVARRVGGDHGEAVAGLGFEVGVGREGDRACAGVDAEGGAIAAILQAVAGGRTEVGKIA